MTLTTVAIIASIASLANFVPTLLCAVRIRKFATEVNDFAHEIISKTDADLQILKRDIKQHVTAVLTDLHLEKPPTTAIWRFSKVKK